MISKQIIVGLKALKREMELSFKNFLESGYVPISVISDWLKKLPSLMQGYDPADSFNANETNLLFFFNVCQIKRQFLKEMNTKGAN